MKTTPRIQKAINISTSQHDGQRRKGLPYPYIVHPYTVALIVAEHTDNEDAFIAALLHDVLEDTKGYGPDEMRADFGPAVLKLVLELSEDKGLPWRERKDHHLEQLAHASETALIITAADKIHNLDSFAETWLSSDEQAIAGILGIARNSLWYFERIDAIFAARLPSHPITKRYQEALRSARPYFSS